MPPLSLPRDDWYRLEILDHHVGWMHAFAEYVTMEDRPAIRVRSELVMRLLRSGTPLELHRVRTVYFAARAPFTAYRFTMSSDESGAERRVEGDVQGETLTLKTFLDGRVTEQEVPLPVNTLFEEAVPFRLHEQNVRIGDVVEISLFNGDILRPMQDRIELVRSEPLEIGGEKRAARLWRHTLDWMGGIETLEWYDAAGVLLRTEMDTLGVPMTMTRTSQEDATQLNGMSEMDVILATKLTIRGRDPDDPARFRVRIRLTRGELRRTIPETSRQSLTPENGSSWALLDIRRDDVPDESLPFPIDDPTFRRYRAPSVYVESDDEEIRAVARNVTANARDAWDAVAQINEWVYGYITDKGLDRGFSTAKQTLDSRAGDCTEHTMLAVALTRAAGIPARILAGVVWQRDAFYYHFWYEAYVGRWIALDPTLGQTPADARHIQLAGGEPESETALEFGEGILRTLNRVEMEALPPHDE